MHRGHELISMGVVFEDDALQEQAQAFASQHGLQCSSIRREDTLLHLVFTSSRVYVERRDQGKKQRSVTKIFVDFTEGKNDYRRQHGGGRGQALAKAIGINAKFLPYVWDATAGMGEDAFVLAGLGCRVEMFERVPTIQCLLRDGLFRLASSEDEEKKQIASKMRLHLQSFLSDFNECSQAPDVVYLDPMFPQREKSAKVKKEMQLFHEIVTSDEDADELLHRAINLATYRVVVKRPVSAPHLMQHKPNHIIAGKTTRFDIYTRKAIPRV